MGCKANISQPLLNNCDFLSTRKSGPFSKHVIHLCPTLTPASDPKRHEQLSDSSAAFELELRGQLAAGGEGTSDRRHEPRHNSLGAMVLYALALTVVKRPTGNRG
jgi:hypothetical protein